MMLSFTLRITESQNTNRATLPFSLYVKVNKATKVMSVNTLTLYSITRHNSVVRVGNSGSNL